jgi:hypothetical protein
VRAIGRGSPRRIVGDAGAAFEIEDTRDTSTTAGATVEIGLDDKSRGEDVTTSVDLVVAEAIFCEVDEAA